MNICKTTHWEGNKEGSQRGTNQKARMWEEKRNLTEGGEGGWPIVRGEL